MLIFNSSDDFVLMSFKLKLGILERGQMENEEQNTFSNENNVCEGGNLCHAVLWCNEIDSVMLY